MLNPDLIKHHKPVVILGAGAWGKTLASLVAQNRHEGYSVRLWSRQSTESLRDIFAEKAHIVVSAVSMAGVRPLIERLKALPPFAADTIFVTATKGLDPVTYQTPSQIWQEAFMSEAVVVLSGPNLSKEIQQGLPAAAVSASSNEAIAQQVQAAFFSEKFRVYTNPDPLGVELGGTLKNVMAIAAGTCDGLQLGTNAKAALLTRGLAEIIRVGTDWGAKAETFYGLSGLGDLLATCNSSLSRNYQVGYQLAQGKTLWEILDCLEGTVEGVNTTSVLVERANRQSVSVPITYQVYRLLKGEITPQAAVEALMLRDTKPE